MRLPYSCQTPPGRNPFRALTDVSYGPGGAPQEEEESPFMAEGAFPVCASIGRLSSESQC